MANELCLGIVPSAHNAPAPRGRDVLAVYTRRMDIFTLISREWRVITDRFAPHAGIVRIRTDKISNDKYETTRWNDERLSGWICSRRHVEITRDCSKREAESLRRVTTRQGYVDTYALSRENDAEVGNQEPRSVWRTCRERLSRPTQPFLNGVRAVKLRLYVHYRRRYLRRF